MSLELPPFFRRLNAQGRQRALVRALLISRLPEDPGAPVAPPEDFESDVEWDHWVGRYL